MPLFRRLRSRSRPVTPCRSCTTSCGRKPCDCNPRQSVFNAPQISCTFRNCCCKRSIPKPRCKIQNCCCRKLESSYPSSNCCQNKGQPLIESGFTCASKCKSPFEQPCRSSSRGLCNPSYCKKSCDQPAPCREQCSTSRSGRGEQPNNCKMIYVKPPPKQPCARPGCSPRKPCITSCQNEGSQRSAACLVCKKVRCVCVTRRTACLVCKRVKCKCKKSC